MEVIFGLIPMMLFFGFLVVVVFIWMAKNGHFDDLDGQANRIFMDDEYPEDTSPEDTTPKPKEQVKQAEEPEEEDKKTTNKKNTVDS